MKIVVDINHPAHVHFFKNFIRIMREKGHSILVTCSKKDVSETLLTKLNIKYTYVGNYGQSLTKKLLNLPILDYSMYKIVKEFRPDIFLGVNSIRAAHISRLLNKTSFSFTDTEHSWEQRMLYMPFTNVVLTPRCFNVNLGVKQVRYDGYHELAYLHPNYFKPDPKILSDNGITRKELFAIIRLVSWDATHDMLHHGINKINEIITKLEEYCSIFISFEPPLCKKLKKYALKISPEIFHDLLYYSTLYMGEGATIASEAALLGTPSFYVSSLAGKMGTLNELEHKYHLLYNYSDTNEALTKAIKLFNRDSVKEVWKLRRQKMINDKIDVTYFIINYVESLKTI